MGRRGFTDLLAIGYEISDRQYASCREAGYTAEDLARADSTWIQQHQSWIFPGHETPITALQMQLVQSYGVDFDGVDIGEATFMDGVKAISKLLLEADDDERYVHAIHERFQRAKSRRGDPC